MFSWNFAKSAEAVFSRWAIKKVCQFLLKKKLGQLILGDVDLNQLDVQLSIGIIQLSDLALNVDYINQKFGAAATLVIKEGSIASLSVKLPWRGRGCEIEVNELELVIATRGEKSFDVGTECSSSGQGGNIHNDDESHDQVTPEREAVDSTLTSPSVDVHEGVKTIAKMVKWLLTSFHVKIKKLIVAFDPSSGESGRMGHCRTLVLRFSKVECGTGISEDVNLNSQATVDNFLGLSRLTNFVKFDGAVLEFLQLDDDDNHSPFPCTSVNTLGEWLSGCRSSNATTQIITGEKGGFSGTLRLSIPWKNGSLDIRKLDAEVFVEPIELRIQPSSLKSLMYIAHAFEELEKNHESFMHSKAMESVYFNAASHGHSSISSSFEFAKDKLFQKPDTSSAESYSSVGKDTVMDALLRGSNLISDWVTSPITTSNWNEKAEEPDFGASVDQFFECFDELRTSQSALGNSGMWNWTCSVFSAITAASNLASGSLHIPSEQKHVETSLKAKIAQIVILFSFVDEDQKPFWCTKISERDSNRFVHYLKADFHEMQLVLQVCPQELNFEATVKHIEVADHFGNVDDLTDAALHNPNEEVKALALKIRNIQAAVHGACPPPGLPVQGAAFKNMKEFAAADASRNCTGIYRDDVVKVLLLRTSDISQGRYTVTSVSPDGSFGGPKSFSLKLPPLVFWVNFHLISTVLDLANEIRDSFETNSTKNLLAQMDGDNRSSSQGNVAKDSRPKLTTFSPEEAVRGNISLLDARIILCFPCEKSEDCKSYASWNQFIVVDLSSPLALSKMKFPNNPLAVPISKESYSLATSHSVRVSVGNLDVCSVVSAFKDHECKSSRKQKPEFCAERVLSLFDKSGCPSVFSMLWQESPVSGPWITKRAKVLATSDGTSSRNKSIGKGHEFASVTTTKDMEDFSSRTREEIVLSSAFFLHVHLCSVIVNLDGTLYRHLHDLLHQVVGWLSCLTSDQVGTAENHPQSQISILVECDSVEVSVTVETEESIKGSIQNELPGAWHGFKLKVGNFELLTVSNIGGIPGASFLWVSHGDGNLWGSTTRDPAEEFVLISCNNSAKGRGNGEGSNILSSRFSGSDIINMWDPDAFVSHLSINIRCGTIIAIGGRLDWFDMIIHFFSLPSIENDQVLDVTDDKEDFRNDTSCGSSFVLNLVDVGLSYEPYSIDMVAHELSCVESNCPYVAGLLVASTLKVSNVSVANSVEMDYKMKAHDVGLLLREVSGFKNIGGSYGPPSLRKSGYVKVAEEAHLEAVLRMNRKDDHPWEVECSESHIVLDTCQDTTSGLIRLAAQLQQIYAPDIEESVVHLQTRWDNVHQAQENYKSRSNHSTSSSSHSLSLDRKMETSMVNLMDEISEGAFSLDGNSDNHFDFMDSSLDNHFGEVSTADHESILHTSFTGPAPLLRLEDHMVPPSHASSPEFIEGYFLSDLRPLSALSLNNSFSGESFNRKSRTVKGSETPEGSSGWYGDSPLKILENHVADVGEKAYSEQLVESEGQTENTSCGKVKGCVLLKNFNIRWRLFAGSDWHYMQTDIRHASTRGRDTAVCLELALSNLGLQYDIFPDGEIHISSLSLSVEDIRLSDFSKDAPWKQVLGYYQSKDHPRESCSKALKLDLEAVRPHPLTPLEEYRLRIGFLPMRLHLHQSQLDFLISFFGGKNSSLDQSPISQDSSDLKIPPNRFNLGSHNIIEEALLPYFQKFSISPVLVRVDYSPSHVDLAALRQGKYVELVNLVPWKGVELQLKRVQAVGVYGWDSVCETIIGEWLEDISQNQIHKLLKGLPPIRSLVAVGSSAAKLVSLPIKNYRKERRIVKGMQRGTIAFLRSISIEAIGLGVHLAAGAHDILLQAEYILTNIPPASVPRPIQSRLDSNVRSNQPKDARQGIQQAFESITDGLGRSASALVQTPLKKFQRGSGVGSALSTAVQAAPGAAIAPASAAARAMHSALLGVRNSLDPDHKKESMDKYLGTTQSPPL